MKKYFLFTFTFLVISNCAKHATPELDCTTETIPENNFDSATISTVELTDAYEGYQNDELFLVDINSEGTREQLGFVPNAILLSSYQFDPAELDEHMQSMLVFYCVNARCAAGRLAAEYAQSLGFTNVHYMPAGIIGWREAEYAVCYPEVNSQNGQTGCPD